MNPALNLDFVASPPRPPLAWLCLLVGALLLAMAADRYADAEDQVFEAGNQLARLQRQQKNMLTTTTVRNTKDTLSQGLQREQKMLDEAARADWKQALAAVEGAVDKDIAILALNQESGGRRMSIAAEARNIDDALAFAERMRGSRKFTEVLVGSHEQHTSTGMPVLGFTVQVSW